MRLRVWSASVVATFAVTIIACVDLFHSTDFDTACTADASASACAGPITLCAASSSEALERAKRACGFLGACEAPIGGNQAGVCIANAVLAYDCAANPNRPPRGESAAFWLCLANAKTCDDIDHCASPATPANEQVSNCVLTTGPFTGCGIGPDSRIQCGATGPGRFENCRAYGQTCTALTNNDKGICAGHSGRACNANQCSGTFLTMCDDAGVDHGLDCSLFGAGTCTSSGAEPSCKPASTIAAAAAIGISCDSNAVATGTVTGFKETIDCKAISGPGSCTPISAVTIGQTPSDACHASECTADTCDGTVKATLHACVHGHVVDVNCDALGLGNCASTSTLEDGTHAACTHP